MSDGHYCPLLISIKWERERLTKVVSECVLLGVDCRGVFYIRLLSVYDYGFDRSRGGNDRLVQLFNVGKSGSLVYQRARHTIHAGCPQSADQAHWRHMLRHACGYKLANDGHDTRAIQDYLGHKSIQHTSSLHGIVAGSVQRLLCELANDPSTMQRSSRPTTALAREAGQHK